MIGLGYPERERVAMMHYRITHPRGGSGTSDLNPAAVECYRARGYTVELIGPSHVRIIP